MVLCELAYIEGLFESLTKPAARRSSNPIRAKKNPPLLRQRIGVVAQRRVRPRVSSTPLLHGQSNLDVLSDIAAARRDRQTVGSCGRSRVLLSTAATVAATTARRPQPHEQTRPGEN